MWDQKLPAKVDRRFPRAIDGNIKKIEENDLAVTFELSHSSSAFPETANLLQVLDCDLYQHLRVSVLVILEKSGTLRGRVQANAEATGLSMSIRKLDEILLDMRRKSASLLTHPSLRPRS